MKTSISKFEFRVWDDKTNKFTYFNLRETLGVLPLDIPDEQIQQYTGFLDKFGKPIFEGDILKTHYYDGPSDEIGYDAVQKVWRRVRGYGQSHSSGFEIPSDREIVGNIYEN